MIEAARKSKVKLMIAYRLHFDEANLSAVEIVQSGKLCVPRVSNSTFTQQGAAVTVPAIAKPKPPTSEQEITRPAVQKPKLVNAESPSGS